MSETSRVHLEPADERNVDLLVTWTLDPIAQGRYKSVPALSATEVREQFLIDPERHYFMIQRTADHKPLGRLYWRAWRFEHLLDSVDWELNIFLADPDDRGKGYGTAAQRLAAKHLESLAQTRSIFAFTMADNVAECRALLKAGFREAGAMPNERYPVLLPAQPCVLFVWPTPELQA